MAGCGLMPEMSGLPPPIGCRGLAQTQRDAGDTEGAREGSNPALALQPVDNHVGEQSGLLPAGGNSPGSPAACKLPSHKPSGLGWLGMEHSLVCHGGTVREVRWDPGDPQGLWPWWGGGYWGMEPHGEAKPFPLTFLQEEEGTVKRH